MAKTTMGHPSPAPPSSLGRSFPKWVVEFPKLAPLPNSLKIDCSSEARVIITPRSIALRSNSWRKLFKSRSKNGSLLFHSTSKATRPFTQSALWVGASYLTSSTIVAVLYVFSFHPSSYRRRSSLFAIRDFDPPGDKISLADNSNSRRAVRTSRHSAEFAAVNTASPCAIREHRSARECLPARVKTHS